MTSLALALRRALVFSGLTATGVVVFFWLHRPDDDARRRRSRESGQPVRVLAAQEYTATPRALGYGVVEAQRNWQGLAEVGGKVVETDERLEVGRRIREGTVLLKIDPGSYELEKTKTEATVKAVRAQIGELKAREQSARANLKVEEKVLALARKDLARLQSLYDQGAVALTEVETAERELLSAERSVLSYKNTLSELPASRKVLEANLQQYKAGVKGAALELARTEVIAPFTMRLREVNAIEGQAVSAGQVLVVGDAVDVMEVPAQFSIASITPLRARGGRGPRAERDAETTTAGSGSDAGAGSGEREAEGDAKATRDGAPDEAPAADASADATRTADAEPPPSADAPAPDATPPSADAQNADAARRGGRWRSIQARVHLTSQGMNATWPADFRRFEGIDSTTHTMGVVVQVDEPRRRDDDGRNQPRLSPGMHVEVELWGAPQPGCMAIPREALHGDVVHVADAKDRLELRPVAVAFTQEDYVCVSEGLRAGDRVVLTDVVPAVRGMLLAPRVDDNAAERLAAATRRGQDAP